MIINISSQILSYADDIKVVGRTTSSVLSVPKLVCGDWGWIEYKYKYTLPVLYGSEYCYMVCIPRELGSATTTLQVI